MVRQTPEVADRKQGCASFASPESEPPTLAAPLLSRVAVQLVSMTASSTILAIDGTTGIHALAFDRDLHPVATATRSLHLLFPAGGYDAREILAGGPVVGEVVSKVEVPSYRDHQSTGDDLLPTQ